jgi:CHAT domain-containing protein
MIVSHWYVYSNSTAKLLEHTAATLSADPSKGPAAALRDAMLWMSSGSAGQEFANPMHWAAFSIVGEPGPAFAGAST